MVNWLPYKSRHGIAIRQGMTFKGESSVTCIHVPVTVYRSGVQDFLCLVGLLCLF